MPRYRSLHVDAFFSSISIQGTAELSPPKHNAVQKREIYNTLENKFLHGTTLPERAVAPQGLTAGLNFIGADETIPFFMVRCGEQLFHETPSSYPPAVALGLVKLNQILGDARRLSISDANNGPGAISVPRVGEITPNRKSMRQTRRTSHTTNPLAASPHPPTETVEIHDKDIFETHSSRTSFFNYQPAPVNPLLAPAAIALVIKLRKASFQSFVNYPEIKADIYLNGEFVESQIQSASRMRGNEASLIFHGRRIGSSVCRPWIVVPVSQDARGELKSFKSNQIPEERWHAVSKALKQEVIKRVSINGCKATPSSDYLKLVSKLGMPDELHNLQRKDPVAASRYGVVDVVLSYGTRTSRANTSRWVCAPTRFVANGTPPIDIANTAPIVKSTTLKITMSEHGLSPRIGTSRIPISGLGRRDSFHSASTLIPGSDTTHHDSSPSVAVAISRRGVISHKANNENNPPSPRASPTTPSNVQARPQDHER